MPGENIKRSLVLSHYPITNEVLDEISAIIDSSNEVLVISTIISSGYLNLIRQLRHTQYDDLYLFVSNDNAKSLLSVMQLISFIVPTKRRHVLMLSGTVERYKYSRLITCVANLLHSTLLGFGTVPRVYFRSKWLFQKSRVTPAQGADQFHDNLAYIKTNLWLGVQAGGAMSHTIGVVRSIVEKGIAVRFLSADDQRGYFNFGVVFDQCNAQKAYTIPRELNHFIYHYQFLKEAMTHLKGFRGVIYQRSSIGNFCGVELSRRLKLPLIVEYNGSESWMSRNWGTPFAFSRTIDAIENVTLLHAHLVVTVSTQLRDELISRGVDAKRIGVHPNGVNPEDFDPKTLPASSAMSIRERYQIPADAIVVTFVGTFGPWHGVGELAKAAMECLNRREETRDGAKDIFFIFIGDGVKKSEVVDLAQKNIQQGQIILTGLVPPKQIPEFLNASDVLVSPTIINPDKSSFFGSPTKLFEYFASGRPVIASDLGQMSEIMALSPKCEDLQSLDVQVEPKSGVIGIRVEPENVSQLVEAIEFCANNPDWRRKVGVRARELVIQKYTWRHHVDHIYARLGQVLEHDERGAVRVLVNAIHSKSGGGVTYLKNVLPHFAEDRRLDVHLCLHQDQLTLFEEYLDGVTLHIFERDASSFLKVMLVEQVEIPLLARRIDADVVFSPANYGPIITRKSVILLRNALSVALVERRPSKLAYWAIIYFGTSLSLFRATAAISVSEYAKRSAAGGMHSLMRTPVNIVPHGISDEFKSSQNVERFENQLLIVSDLYVQKNIHSLFEGLPQILKRFPNIKIQIAGRPIDTGYVEKLEKLLKKFEITEAVNFLGHVDASDLPKLYQECTIFVFTSSVETFGNPLVEAMACGAPIACSNTAAMPEVAGEAAEYFNPHRPSEIADVICALLANPKRRAELSELAIKRASLYSWEETARRTSDVLITAAES